MQALLPLQRVAHAGELAADGGQVAQVGEVVGARRREEVREVTGGGVISCGDNGGGIELLSVDDSCEQRLKFVPLPRELHEVRVHGLVFDKNRIEVKSLLNFLGLWLLVVI